MEDKDEYIKTLEKTVDKLQKKLDDAYNELLTYRIDGESIQDAKDLMTVTNRYIGYAITNELHERIANDLKRMKQERKAQDYRMRFNDA